MLNNVSFFQILVFLILIFLMFGDIKNLFLNFDRIKKYFSKDKDKL